MKQIPKKSKSLNKFLATSSSILLFGLNPVNPVNAVITTSVYPDLPYPYVADCLSCDTGWIGPNRMTLVTAATCNHASGIVNGHFSSNPTVNLSNQTYDLYSRASHTSHGSHGQW